MKRAGLVLLFPLAVACGGGSPSPTPAPAPTKVVVVPTASAPPTVAAKPVPPQVDPCSVTPNLPQCKKAQPTAVPTMKPLPKPTSAGPCVQVPGPGGEGSLYRGDCKASSTCHQADVNLYSGSCVVGK